MSETSHTGRPQLKKTITGTGFFCLAFGSMIGVGWITTLGDWLEPAGPMGAMAAFLAGGFLMLLIGLCYAELTPMMPVTGGEVAYAYKAMGTGKAFWVGWFLAFGYISVCAFEAVSIGIVSGYLFPVLDVFPLYEIHGYKVYLPHLVLGLVFTTLIGWINYRGINVAIKLQVGLTILLVLCVSCFVVAGLANGSTSNLEPYFGSAEGSFSWAGFLPGFLTVFVMAPFWFVGFDTIPQTAEEYNSPRLVKRLGLFIIWAIAGSAVFYVLVILAASMASPWQSTVTENLPTAAAFRSAFESDLLANLVLIAGLIGLLTSWNGFFIAGTRVLFALGRGHIIGSSLGHVHPQYGTPTKAIWLCSIATALGTCLGKGALIAFIDVGSFCIAFAFLGVSLSLLKLRQTSPEMERPYRLPFGKGIAVMAAMGSLFILLALLIPKSPVALVYPLEWVILFSLVIVGMIFWFTSEKVRRGISETRREELILKPDDQVVNSQSS